MSFDFDAPNTKCNITVGYISSERGFVDGVGIHEANKYAKLNPGTQFIFRNRDFVKYLNINEVNALTPEMMLPQQRSGAESCSGIVGLNLEGDISKSIDVTLDTEKAYTGGSTKDSNVKPEPPKKRVNFYGGGGVGVQAAPIIGIDGSILAVQVIHGGYGYKYPPIVDIIDDTGKGGGVVARSIIKTRSSDEAVFVEEFDREEDYEEYVLDKCVPELETVGYGQRWGPDGKNLGKWDPNIYFTKTDDPIKYQIQQYQQYLNNLQKGATIENGRIKGWWTTRQKPPLRVVSGDKVTREVFDVFHWAWGSKPGTNDAIDNLYIKLFGRRGEPRGLQYWKDIQSTGKSLAQVEEGMKTFPEWQKVCEGECKPVMPDVTYLFGQYYEYDKESFINKYGISPQQSSNVPSTDHAGKTFIFEWEEEFPFDGEYIFNVQADNTAHLYIDNESVGEDIVLGSGGAKGNVLSPPQKIKKFVSAGMRKITLDLRNGQKMEMKKIQKDVVDTSDEVKFDISISSMFANGITIEGLGVDVSSVYEGPVVKETITKKVEYGRVYPVKIRSSNQRVVGGGNGGGNGDGTAILYEDLNPSNKTIRVVRNNTRIELKDGRGNDANVKFTITSGDAKFSDDGRRIIGKGKVGLNLWYDDNPRYSGEAVRSITIGETKWVKERKHKGGESKTITLDGVNTTVGGTTVGGSNNSNIILKTKGEKVIAMEDLPGQEAGSGGVGGPGFFDDLICSVNNGRFFGISGSTCSFMVDPPAANPNSTLKGERLHVFNTLDWIKKADRKLWKINPGAGKDADFLNKFGVLPFDPTEVAKVEKKRKRTVEIEQTGVPPSVKFEVGDDGKNYLKVIGNGRVKVGFEMDVDDYITRGGTGYGWSVKEVRIKADDGEIILKRSGAQYEKLYGTGTFSSGKKYLVKSTGGAASSGSKIGVDKTLLQFDDGAKLGDLAFDGRGYSNVRIKSVNRVKITKQIEETVLGYPDYPNASTDDYAGFHTIVWKNINFPEDGNYYISTMVDDNVVLTFSKPNQKDIVLDKKGFRIRGDARTGTGKSTEIKYFKAGSYTLNAVLEQVPGAPLANGNPMALAVDIKSAFVSDEIEVVSVESWNQNPFAVAMTIDVPLAPPPKELPQQQEGRCPNNPIWTTRTPTNETWYPVNVDKWGKFMNRYAISPLPPLGLKGTDGAGTVFRNTWKVELPYKGYYGVKGTVDNFGRLFIDGVEVLGPDAEVNFDSYKSLKPKVRKIFLEKKTIDVTVELENEKQFIWNTIDQKVFSTADWSSIQSNAPTQNIDDVTFKVNIGTLYAAGIKLFDSNTGDVVFENNKAYAADSISASHTKKIEVGKAYDVEFTSSCQTVVPGELSPERKPLIIEGEGKLSGNRRIRAGGNTYQFDNDGSDWDMNATFTIVKGGIYSGGDAKFEEIGGEPHPYQRGKRIGGTPTIVGTGKVTIKLWWNDTGGDEATGGDAPNLGKAIRTIRIGNTVWDATRGHSSNKVSLKDRTRTIDLGSGDSTGDTVQKVNNNSAIQLRTRGKNVIEMEDIPSDFSAGTGGTNDERFFYKDIVCAATKGEFYNLQGRKCKYRIPPKDKTTPEEQYTKDGVTYKGPALYNYQFKGYGEFLNKNGVSPDYPKFGGGDIINYEWSNIDFPEDGEYDFHFAHDAHGSVYLDGKEIIKGDFDAVAGISARDSANWDPGIKRKIKVNKGKHTITVAPSDGRIGERSGWSDGLFKKLSDDYYRGQQAWHDNASALALGITRKVQVAKIDPRTGTALGKSWVVNPLGVSAILIPPPCPKKIDGVGIVTSVIITDPGNGFDPPIRPDGDGDPSGPPVILELVEVIPEEPGINYGPDDKVCIVNTETGEEVCYIPPKGPFGEIFPFDPRETPPEPPGPPDPPDVGDPPPTAPPTVTITATPPVIPEGKCTELVYTSKVNTKLTIDKGVGDVPVVPRGIIKVCPTETTTYCITGDVGGTACAVVTVVKDPDDPLLDAPPDDGKEKPPNGYREYPQIIVRGRGTGIGYKGIPILKPVLDPIGVDPKRLIQVTDLPGLKQTGYYNGKPYYGAIFYENGISYAGYYDTPGQKVQIYATLQESIDATVTTPPSAIQRQGTDVNSNNPRLNIPGTPDNLT